LINTNLSGKQIWHSKKAMLLISSTLLLEKSLKYSTKIKNYNANWKHKKYPLLEIIYITIIVLILLMILLNLFDFYFNSISSLYSLLFQLLTFIYIYSLYIYINFIIFLFDILTTSLLWSIILKIPSPNSKDSRTSHSSS
jgi:hypothetical protein